MIRLARLPALALAPLALPVTAFAQEVTELRSTGDLTDHNGAVVEIVEAGVIHSGAAYALCHTDHPDPGRRQALDRYGWWFLEPGYDTAWGRPLCGIRSMGMGGSQFYVLDMGPGGQWVAGDYCGLNPGLITGQSASDIGFGPQSTYTSFDALHVGAGYRFLLHGVVEQPSSGSVPFLSRGKFLLTGALKTHVRVARGGDPIGIGGEPLVEVYTHTNGAATNVKKHVLWTGAVDAGGATETVCVLNGAVVAQEGEPSPVPGRAWGRFEEPAVHMTEGGSWTLVARLDDSDPSTAPVIVRDGAVIRRAGDVVADFGPLPLVGFGGGRAVLDGKGRVLWLGRFDVSDEERDEALLLDEWVLVREGSTRLLGELVVGFGARPHLYDLYPYGGRAIVRVTLESGREVLVGLDISYDLGQMVCFAGANSLGLNAPLTLSGFTTIELDNLMAHVKNLPPHEPVILLAGDVIKKTPFANTALCVSQDTVRLMVGDSGPAGVFEERVDLASLAALGHLAPGDAWTFQLWYRDSNGTHGMNLSSAKRVVFE